MLTGTIDMPALVANFYEAAADSTRWAPAWRLLAGNLQANSGTLFLEDTPNRTRRVIAQSGTPAAAYEPFPLEFGLSDDAMRRAYGHFATAHFSALDVLLSFIELGRGRRLVAAFHRGADGIPFDRTDARLLDRSVEHLAGAFRHMERWEHERENSSYAAVILDNVPIGTILLSADGWVLFINQTANRLCGPQGLLIFNNMRGVEAYVPAENLRLQGLILGVRAGEEGGILRITRPAPQNALAVRVHRAPASGTQVGHRALLILRELSRRPAARGGQVKELFGLTTAESEVLDELLDGLTARSIAEKRNVSLYTVQAQVRHILAKTGAEKMRDLVRMMSALFG